MLLGIRIAHLATPSSIQQIGKERQLIHRDSRHSCTAICQWNELVLLNLKGQIQQPLRLSSSSAT